MSRLRLAIGSTMVLAFALLRVPGVAADPPASEPVQPNVLIIMADDLGAFELGSYASDLSGSPAPDPAVTPVLDDLAADGVRFTRAWSYPVCSSTRSTVHTGRYGIRTGTGKAIPDSNPSGVGELRGGELTLAESLSASGYTTALVGKWHLGINPNGNPNPNTPDEIGGFDHFSGTLKGDLQDYYLWKRTVNAVEEAPTTTYATTAQVDDALDWLGGQDGPWFLTLAFNAPHKPFHVPPRKLMSASSKRALRGLPEGNCPAGLSRECFKAAIEAMDTEIGRLLDRGNIDRDNTLIFFMGDNGTTEEAVAAGFDATRAKGTVYQGGVNVPFLVDGPTVSGGRVSNALVNTTDVFATVSEVTGAAPPATPNDSFSFADVLADPAGTTARAFLYTEIFVLGTDPHSDSTAMSAYSDGTHKVIELADQLVECYDLSLDPFETSPLALDGPCASLYSALEAGLHSVLP